MTDAGACRLEAGVGQPASSTFHAVSHDSREDEPLSAVGRDPAQVRNRWLMAQQRDQLDRQILRVDGSIGSELAGSRSQPALRAVDEIIDLGSDEARLLALHALQRGDRLPIREVTGNSAAQ